jgi:hypothetical protein
VERLEADRENTIELIGEQGYRIWHILMCQLGLRLQQQLASPVPDTVWPAGLPLHPPPCTPTERYDHAPALTSRPFAHKDRGHHSHQGKAQTMSSFYTRTDLPSHQAGRLQTENLRKTSRYKELAHIMLFSSNAIQRGLQ